MSPELSNRLTARLKQVLDSEEKLVLRHRNGITEELIVGTTGDSVFVYNTEPDLVRAFEVEGGPSAREINIAECAKWLYWRSFEPVITR